MRKREETKLCRRDTPTRPALYPYRDKEKGRQIEREGEREKREREGRMRKREDTKLCRRDIPTPSIHREIKRKTDK